MTVVYIAEKPGVAKDIVSAMGGNFVSNDGFYQKQDTVVTWCYGHLLTTVEPGVVNPSYSHWKLEDLPLNLFPLQYKIKEGAEKQAKIVIKLIQSASMIVHAGDPDDEGQLLVEELLLYAGNKANVKRLLINDNTKPAIQKALNNLQDNKKFIGQYHKALTRQAADLIFGLSLTRACSIIAGNGKTFSVGRVQTPIVGLIVNRYKENENHRLSYYYTLSAFFKDKKQNTTFKGVLQNQENYPLDDKNRIIDADFIKNIDQNIHAAGSVAKISDLIIQDKKINAPLPFNLVRLQQYANVHWGYTAQKTLDITQSLREKYKAITYNRSDCSYLSEEQYLTSPGVIDHLSKKDQFSSFDFDSKIKSFAFNDSKISAHTAIIPTITDVNLLSMSEEEQNIYLIICKYFLAQFLKPIIYKLMIIQIDINGYIFKSSCRKIIDRGFSTLLKDNDLSSGDEQTSNDFEESEVLFEKLKLLSRGDIVSLEESKLEKKETKPLPLFTEASLLSALTRVASFVKDEKVKQLLQEKDKDSAGENGGIGTPATRGIILESLKKRGFIEVKKGKLIPTPLGISFISQLPSQIVNPDLTALWFEKQKDIEAGQMTVGSFIDSLYKDIKEILSNLNINSDELKKSSNQDIIISSACPKCKSDVALKKALAVCENKGCDFKIWRRIASKNLTDTNLKDLISKGRTKEVKGFVSKQGKKFDAVLIINNDHSVKFDFN